MNSTMSSTATSQSESLLIGTPSSPAAASISEVVFQEFGTSRPLPLPNTRSLASLVTEFEADPEMAQHLTEARQNLAVELYADEPETLSALRLAAGLSQAQLAERVGTYQPYIVRLERGQADPSTDMIARLARALGVDDEQAFRSVRNQRATRG